MCEGYGLIGSFEAGTRERPHVPEVVRPSLRRTDDGVWVVMARKVARHIDGDRFIPATGGAPYPRDAIAECRRGRSHAVPDEDCSCGFHAVSEAAPEPYGGRFTVLEVALSGRILASHWIRGGLLFRAERQTVITWSDITVPQPVRLPDRPPQPPTPPLEPGGRAARLRPPDPRGLDRAGLRLPVREPQVVRLADDAGYCVRDAHRGKPRGQRNRWQHREDAATDGVLMPIEIS
ncbi:hypothetical protein ACFXPS_35455 [Nocardia sp. NPDC059091]|uniref:hypothetical protein n=1 Tax=unclassified Nocardia TaxID=2637762 RepID=UPI0036A68CE6